MVGIPDSIVKKTLTDRTYYIDVVICGGGNYDFFFEVHVNVEISRGFATPLP